MENLRCKTHFLLLKGRYDNFYTTENVEYGEEEKREIPLLIGILTISLSHWGY
jgi:hypothetical protein